MGLLRLTLRLIVLTLHIALGLVFTLVRLRGVEDHSPDARQRQIITQWVRRANEIMGLKITAHGEIPPSPVLVVANHISWLDIMVIASLLPVSFLSKAEIRNWPIVGKLTGGSGTLFIQRGERDAANQAAEKMVWQLRRGQNVAIFPEGTTTEGTDVRRFHPRLFSAAIHTGVAIQPVAICYPHPDGVNPLAPFIGNTDLIRHGLRILRAKRVEVDVTFCPLIPARQHDRRALAEESGSQIKRTIERKQSSMQAQA